MSFWNRVMRTTGRAIDLVFVAASWMVLPLSLLLFLQWPLRELVQAYSREANDLAQILFALYASIAITAATRSNCHLAVDVFAHAYAPSRRRQIARWCAALVLLPWAVYLLVTAAPLIQHSVAQWEGFPETFNPGYFIVKIAVGVLGVLVALQALLDTCGPDRAAS